MNYNYLLLENMMPNKQNSFFGGTSGSFQSTPSGIFNQKPTQPLSAGILGGLSNQNASNLTTSVFGNMFGNASSGPSTGFGFSTLQSGVSSHNVFSPSLSQPNGSQGSFLGQPNSISAGASLNSQGEINPGTQMDRFSIKKNQEFEVHAYNYNEKFSSHSLKMLRLQDYLNFKNNKILEEHKPHVVRYFHNLKNNRPQTQNKPQMSGVGILGNSIGRFS